MDTILDKIPPSELSKLPLPAGFEKLPPGVYDRLKVTCLLNNPTVTSANPRRRIDGLDCASTESPWTHAHSSKRTTPCRLQRHVVPANATKRVWGCSSSNSVSTTHCCASKRQAECPRKERTSWQSDATGSSWSVSKVCPFGYSAKNSSRLPLPPLMRKLPEETQQRIRSIMHDYKTPWNDRHQKVREFVKSLPVEERRMMRPPMPTFVKDFPQEVLVSLCN